VSHRGATMGIRRACGISKAPGEQEALAGGLEVVPTLVDRFQLMGVSRPVGRVLCERLLDHGERTIHVV
jgi:hypothetical protein